jgi:large subunit ribosomal protein L4
MPLKQRRLARNNAILAKILSGELKLLESLSFSNPKTKDVVKVLKALGADRSVLIATQGIDRNVYLGGRNIPKAVIKPAADINAYDVTSTRTMVITKAAFEDVLKTAKPSKVKTEEVKTKTKTAKANG